MAKHLTRDTAKTPTASALSFSQISYHYDKRYRSNLYHASIEKT
ncbi:MULTISPECIES: hypothetical protein [unclassified Bartonella]